MENVSISKEVIMETINGGEETKSCRCKKNRFIDGKWYDVDRSKWTERDRCGVCGVKLLPDGHIIPKRYY